MWQLLVHPSVMLAQAAQRALQALTQQVLLVHAVATSEPERSQV
jgi:hypothetical protein